MMDMAVLGATGRTGTHLVETLLARGHSVRVLVRDSAKLGDIASRVTVVTGDSRDAEALRTLVAGTSAVISALGPSGKEAALHKDTATALAGVLSDIGPRRFVGVSGAGIDLPGDQKAIRDKAISAIINLVGGAVVKDKPAEYAVWAATDLDWTLVRPPRLGDGTATGRVEHHAHASTKSTRITRADLAAFLVDCVEQGLYTRQAPFVANR